MDGDWDQVRFSVDEEGVTVNNIDLSGKDDDKHPLYDVRTVATISTADGGIKSQPRVSATMAERLMVVALDRVVMVLEAEAQRVLSLERYDVVVDCVAITDDSEFLLTCTRDGIVTLTYVPGDRKLFSKVIAENPVNAEDPLFATAAFVPTDSTIGVYGICLCVRNRKIVSFNNIQLGKLRQVIIEEHDDLVYENVSVVEMAEIDIQCSFCKLIGCSLMITADDSSISLVCILNGDVRCSWSCSDETIRQVALCGDKKSIIVLDNSNRIVVLCSSTFAVVKCWIHQDRVEQFVLIDSLISSRGSPGHVNIILKADRLPENYLPEHGTGILCESQAETQEDDQQYINSVCHRMSHNQHFLWLVERLYQSKSCAESSLLMSCLAEDCQRSVQLCRFPTFATLYSMRTSRMVHLVSMPADQDCTYFLDSILFNKDGCGVQEFAVTEISESIPELRLNRMLNRLRFDEALAFAETFSLDLQLVYTSKINHLLDRLSTCRSANHFSSERGCTPLKMELYACLNQISDVSHVVNCCVHVSLPALDDVAEILHYAESRVQSAKFSTVDSLYVCVKDKLDRLSTFELLYGASQFDSLWDDFVTVNLLDQFRRLLRLGNLTMATLLWQRHRGSFLRGMESDDVAPLLNELPETVPLDVLGCWLGVVFLPDIFTRFPAASNDVAQWFICRSCILEIIDHHNWQEKATRLLNVFVDSWEQLLAEDTEVAAALTAQAATCRSSFVAISRLLDDLADLRELQTVHACSISLADYTQTNKVSVATSLLYCISLPENVEKFIRGFLTRFVATQALSMDVILSNFVRDLLEEESVTSNWWEAAHWEEQALELIKFIGDDDCYLETVLRIASASPVPWSAAVVQLVDASIRHDHPLVMAITKQQVWTKQKDILLRYELEKYALSEHTAEGLARFIVHREVATAMDDAAIILQQCQPSSIVDAYCMRLRYLITVGKDYKTFIRDLPTEMARVVCERLIIHVDIMTRDSCTLRPDVVDMYLAAALHALEVVRCHGYYLDKLTRMAKLRNQFGLLDLTGGVLDDVATCWKLFENTVQCVLMQEGTSDLPVKQRSVEFVNERRKGARIRVGLHQLPWLGKLLGLNMNQILSVLARTAVLAANLESLEWALDEMLFSHSYRMIPGDCVLQILEEVVLGLTEKHPKSTLLDEVCERVSRLTSDMFVSCDPEFLVRLSSLNGWIESLKNLRPPRNGFALGAVALPVRDPYEYWSFTPVYKEVTTKNDPAVAMVMFSNCLRTVLEAVSSRSMSREDSEAQAAKFVQQLGTSVLQLVRHLQANGQPCLALTVYKKVACAARNLASSRGWDVDRWLSAATTMRCGLLKTLFNSTLLQRRMDGPFALSLLLSLPAESAVSMLENSSNVDYTKSRVLAAVGEVFAQVHFYNDMAAHYRREHCLAEWGKRLVALNVAPTGGLRYLHSRAMDLVATLACHQQVELPFLIEFCDAFRLNRMEIMMLATSALLGATYDHDGLLLATVSSDYAGQTKTLTQALALCADLIGVAGAGQETEESLLFALNSEVDPYNYEAITFVLETLDERFGQAPVISKITQKGLAVIAILGHYRRGGTPSQYEMDVWEERQRKTGRPLPAISHRMPFQPLFLDNVWEIISSEVSGSNVSVWLKLAPILELKENHLLMKTFSNLVSTVSCNVIGNEPWTMNCEGKRFVVNAHDLLSRFSVAEEATCCACAGMDKLPSGTIKQAMNNEAIQCALGWVRAGSTKASRVKLESLQRQYKRLAVEKILHGYGLTDPVYLALSDKPEQLVVALMHHPLVGRHSWFPSESWTDIQAVCTDVEVTCQIELDSMRVALLNKWLSLKEDVATCLDESYLDESPLQDNDFNERNSDELNLNRAIYFLRNGPAEDNVIFLANMIMSMSSISGRQRYRALLSLLRIADSATIASCLDVSDIGLYARSQYFSAKLESLNLRFESYSDHGEVVHELCLQLLHDYSHHAVAVTLAAELCLDSGLFSSYLWSTILELMTKLKLFKPLERTLLQLADVDAVTRSTQAIDGWQVILTEYQDLSTSYHGLDKLALLHSCPRLPDAMLLSLAEHYLSAGLPAVGLDCLLHLAEANDRHRHIELFINNVSKEELLNHVGDLRSTAGSLYHLEEVTRVVLTSTVCVGVETWPSWQWFLHNVIRKNPEFSDILLYAHRTKMFIPCANLMQLANDGYTSHLDVAAAKLLIKNYFDNGILKTVSKD